jgi:hypothetical protein
MKTSILLTIFILSVAITTIAQEKPASKQKSAIPTNKTGIKSNVNSMDDLDGKMVKIKEVYNKLIVNVKDQKIKADLKPLLSKMKQLIHEYNASKALSGARLQKTRKQLESKVMDVIKMHGNLKTKYGAIVGDCC